MYIESSFRHNELCYGTVGFREQGKLGADRKWWLFLLGITMVSVPRQCICSLMNSGRLVQCVNTHPSIKKIASD